MKFKPTVAIIFSLWAIGASAQGYDTDCTRDYFGNVSCKSRPAGGDSSFVDLMGFQRGADLANSQNQYNMMQQQNMLMQQRLMQQQQYQQQQELQQLIQQQIRCSQVPLGMGASVGCY